MKEYVNVVIGFGKAGKTLATTLAGAGQKTALIEKDPRMYGGTCINVACIPSKSLENSARLSHRLGGDFAAHAQRYVQAMAEKRQLVGRLNKKNYDKVVSAGVDVLTGQASFLDARHVEVVYPDGTREQLSAQRIFINTGARPFIPPVAGMQDSRHVYVSETMMELEELPRELVILGGGYIGLEFASYYLNFGSQVTVLQDGHDFMPREDQQVAQAVRQSLIDRGARLVDDAKLTKVADDGADVELTVETPSGVSTIRAQALLVATGRRPNVEGLALDKAGVKLTERGAIAVDDRLRTSVEGIWAMGDVTGGLQFTYISLDDFRIVKAQLLGDGSRSAAVRGAVPYSVFVDPPLSRVGLTEQQAVAQGRQVAVAVIPAAAVPKAQLLGQTTGLLKAVVDKADGTVLGLHLFCAESHEMINLGKMAIDARLPYTVLADAIYTHPTMTEAFNDLFGAVRI